MAKPTPTQSATVSTDDQNTETVIRKPERFNTKENNVTRNVSEM